MLARAAEAEAAGRENAQLFRSVYPLAFLNSEHDCIIFENRR